MTKAETARVFNATVRLDDKGGQGVLVHGGVILTAAHCIKWSGEGGMALGDYSVENVTTKSGAHLKVGPWAADPVSDIAVLGSLDNQEFFDECMAVEQWCEATAPVPLANITPRYRVPVRGQVLTHRDEWIGAKIVRWGQSLSSGVSVEADDRIEGGTSGGPVVDSSGRLVGVVSWFSEVAAGEKCSGSIPMAHLALPRWSWLLISSAARQTRKRKKRLR
jgi:hypothetical protein